MSYSITYFNIDIMSMFMSMFSIIFITFSYNIAISSIYMSMLLCTLIWGTFDFHH